MQTVLPDTDSIRQMLTNCYNNCFTFIFILLFLSNIGEMPIFICKKYAIFHENIQKLNIPKIYFIHSNIGAPLCCVNVVIEVSLRVQCTQTHIESLCR